MDRILKKQSKWYKKETKLKNKCKHKNALKKYVSNTGNYDSTTDSEWITYTCPDCAKHWSEIV